MAAFIITGNSDEASAKLKATLEASDSKFNASLEALFKSPSPRTPAPAPAPAPAAAAAPAAGSHASAGWSLGTNRNRSSDSNDAGSLRGRLRTSLRVNPSR